MAEGDEWPYRLNLSPIERRIYDAIEAQLSRQADDRESGDRLDHIGGPLDAEDPHICIDGHVNIHKLARAIAVALELSDSPPTRAPAVQPDKATG